MSTFVRRHNEGTLFSHSANNNDTYCFNCRTRGHSYQKCPVPLIKCQKCLKVGHDSITCELSVHLIPARLPNLKRTKKL